MGMKNWKKIGMIGVDAGICWIGDPCYVFHKGADFPEELGKSWEGFCKILSEKTNKRDVPYTQFHPHLGVCVDTGWGDGIYSVYAKIKDGRVMAVMVDFEGEMEDV